MKQLDPVLVHIRNDIKVMDIANYSRIVTTKKIRVWPPFFVGSTIKIPIIELCTNAAQSSTLILKISCRNI